MRQNGDPGCDGFLISSYRRWVADEEVPLRQDFLTGLRQVEVARREPAAAGRAGQ